MNLLMVLLSASVVHAASSSLKIPGGGQVLVDAKYASRDYDQGTLELRGDVKIIYSHNYLSCDKALINEKTHIIQATGNVIMSSTQAYVEGDSAILNYTDNTGLIQNGFVKSGQVIFEGTVVRKTGPLTYEAENSYYTACTTCPAAWTFEGTRMKAEIGGYAAIKYPIMKVAGFPVFWLPYLIIPLKSERQSGFLIPTFEFNNGVAIGLVYFWAINRSQDATFTLKSYSLRGEKGLVDYRYLLNEKSGGELNAGMIHDQTFPAEIGIPSGNKGFRWFMSFQDVYELPGDVSQRANLNIASDLLYPRDFAMEMTGQYDPALENKFSLTKNTFSTHSSIEADYYVNMLKSNPIDGNDDAVHRWPEIRFSVVNTPVLDTRLLFAFNLDYVNFSRDSSAYDNVIQARNGPLPADNFGDPAAPNGYPKQIDTSRNGTARLPSTANTPYVTQADPSNPTRTEFGGTFNPANDIVRTGQRLDLSPQISYPFSIGKYIDILPTAQYRHTQYAFNVSPPSTLPDGTQAVQYDSTPYRSYAYGQVSARTRFYRIFGNQSESPKRPDPSPPTTNWVDEESRSEADDYALIAPKRPDLYRHEIMPEIVATYLPYLNEPSNHPFFNSGTQQPIFLKYIPLNNDDFYQLPSLPPGGTVPTPVAGQLSPTPTSIQFDYYDRITTRNTLSAYVTNSLVRKQYVGETPVYKQFLSWRLGEAYDFSEASRVDDPRLPWSDVTSDFDLQVTHFQLTTSTQYFPYHHVANSISSVRLKNEKGTTFVGMDYSQIWNVTRYVQNTTRAGDYVSFSTGFKAKYADVVAGLNFTPQQPWPPHLDLNSWATDLKLRPPGNCWVFKIIYQQAFAGPMVFQFELEYNFGGAPSASSESTSDSSAGNASGNTSGNTSGTTSSGV